MSHSTVFSHLWNRLSAYHLQNRFTISHPNSTSPVSSHTLALAATRRRRRTVRHGAAASALGWCGSRSGSLPTRFLMGRDVLLSCWIIGPGPAHLYLGAPKIQKQGLEKKKLETARGLSSSSSPSPPPSPAAVVVVAGEMGIKGLTKLLADNAPKAMKEQKFESYFGRRIAVDASMSIYQFLIVVGRTGMETLTNEAGEVTSHLQGMFNRTIRLLEAGIKPVYVFDGKPPDMKKEELSKRYTKREDATEGLTKAVEAGDTDAIEKFSKRTVKVTKQHNDDCKRLLRLMGVPVVEAPCEAEAECAALCINDKVYAVASEDMDSLTFGAPRFLRHLMDPSSKKIPVMEFEVAKVLEELEFTMDQFIDLCILCGCDYCGSIKGVGGQTALKLIRQHGSIESILENINKDKYQIPEDWPYQEARRLFKEPNVTLDIPELKWTAPDEEGLVNFLVKENGFNQDRVTKSIEKIKSAKNKSSQGRLESFFKPTVITSAPLKRKETLEKTTNAVGNKKTKSVRGRKK